MILTFIFFILILSILVFVHEAGHFFVAKWSGIKVEEFGFGLPPRAWGKKVGETIYSVNWLPFGGFVKLFGEDDAGAGRVSLSSKAKTKKRDETKEPDASRAFFTKPLKNRIAVVVAGVCMNLLLGVFIYYVILASHGFTAEVPLLFEHTFAGVKQTNKFALIVGKSVENSPAQMAGLVENDRIIGIDNQQINNIESFKSYIDAKRGQPVTLTVATNIDTRRQVTLTPRLNVPADQGPIGVEFKDAVSTAVLQYKTVPQKLFSGFIQAYNVSMYSFEVFGKIIGISVQERNIEPLQQGVAGPVGIGKLVHDILSQGIAKAVFPLLELSALLSLNLAVVNILPFPALDGGRLLFLVIEGVTRRRVKPELERSINVVGMALILGLILLITYNDILKIVK